MNAVELLKQDHKIVEDLFKQVEDTPASKHPAIFTKIKGELDAHAFIEETIFYPFAKKQGKKNLVDIVLEGIEEHVQIKMFLKGIAALSAKAERFEPKLKVLIEDTRHHVKEEESEMFKLAKEQLSDSALEKLGEKMEAAKQRYYKTHGIKPVKRDAARGALETFIDNAKQMVGGIIVDAPEPRQRSAKKASAGKDSVAQNADGRTTKESSSKRSSSWDKANAKLQARGEK